ncbi:MAG TPA: TVP38/TMEM64 family protein [Gemmataceae bacterium]|nr:TVP38/TMEM64 family protein [Gemmataceae bacterium]
MEDRPVEEDVVRPAWHWKLLLLGVFAVLIATFYLSGLHHYFSWTALKQSRDDWRAMADQNREVAIVVFVLMSIVLMSLSLPVGSILSMAAGAMFDQWLGFGIITLTSVVGATLAFLSSRYLFRDFVRRWFGRWIAIVDRGIHRDGALYLLMLRLSPVVPFFAVNATMGLTNMRTRTFVWVSLIGMIPSCFLYVMVGTQIMRIDQPSDIISWKLVAILMALAIVPLCTRWFFRRRSSSPVTDPSTKHR